MLHLWSGNWNDKDLKFLISKKKKKKEKENETDLLFFEFIDSNRYSFFTDHDALHVLYFLIAYVTSSITGENIIYSVAARNCTGGSA